MYRNYSGLITVVIIIQKHVRKLLLNLICHYSTVARWRVAFKTLPLSSTLFLRLQYPTICLCMLILKGIDKQILPFNIFLFVLQWKRLIWITVITES